MFTPVIENYKKLSISDKRQEIVNELKLMIAIFEKLCDDNNIQYREIKSREILDLKNGNETESDYLEAIFIYVEYLKEVLGSYLESNKNKNV